MAKRKAAVIVAKDTKNNDKEKTTENENVGNTTPKKLKSELKTQHQYTGWEYYENGGWNSYNENATKFLQDSVLNQNPLITLEPCGYTKKKSEKRIRCNNESSSCAFFIVKDRLYKMAKDMNK